MKRQTIYAALALLALATPAAAQSYGPQGYPEQGYPAQGNPAQGYPAQGYPAGGLPPREVLSILRSTGLDPLGPPVRRGPNYVLRAVDENDREVRVIVNARSGDVLSVTPVQTASRMPPQRGGVTMGPYERMPPGYVPSDADRSGPPAGYRTGAPAIDDDDEPVGYNNSNAPRPPGPMPGALPPSRSSNAAPPPRGGAMPRDRDDDVSSLSEPNVITADPDRNGVLPPPPERFPQRAAPAAPPKPMKHTAAAPPKQAPLPKPRPAAKADAPPPAAEPQSSPPGPGTDETPN